MINANDNTEENAKMTDCYYETKDWRACKKEVRHPSRLDSFEFHSGLNQTVANVDIRWRSSASAGNAMEMRSELIPRILDAPFKLSPPSTSALERAHAKVPFFIFQSSIM